MFMSRLSRLGLCVVRELAKGNRGAVTRAGCNPRSYSRYLRTQKHFEEYTKANASRGEIFQKYHGVSSAASESPSDGDHEPEQTISVTFVDKDGEEQHIKVPIGMSMLEAAHENDIELEGACEGSLACSTCHVIVMDVEYYNKLEDPTDEENDMLDLAFGLSETSRLGCQVIAKPELEGIRLAIPAATRNFAVDGYVPKPH